MIVFDSMKVKALRSISALWFRVIFLGRCGGAAESESYCAAPSFTPGAYSRSAAQCKNVRLCGRNFSGGSMEYPAVASRAIETGRKVARAGRKRFIAGYFDAGHFDSGVRNVK
jgi:hypothetical protein